MSKSKKMYKDSPSIKKGEGGKPEIKKPSKADSEDMGVEGNPLEGAGDGVPVDPKAAERNELSMRHVEEIKDMHKRHEKDHDAMHKRHNTDLAGTPGADVKDTKDGK